MTFKRPVLRPSPPNLDRLRSLSLLSDLTTAELAIVAPLLHERDYPAGEVIFNEGEVGQTIYFLLAGEVTICRQGSPENGPLAWLDPGEFFGEQGLLEDSIRTVQARAGTDCRLLVLCRDDFASLMESHLRIAHKIGRLLLRHLSLRLRGLGLLSAEVE